MRMFLVIFGWASVVGSIIDAALALFVLWIIAAGAWSDPGLSMDAFLKHHLAFIYWVKQLAYYILPEGFVTWAFNLPALIVFPVRAIVSVFIGNWALAVAGRMR